DVRLADARPEIGEAAHLEVAYAGLAQREALCHSISRVRETDRHPVARRQGAIRHGLLPGRAPRAAGRLPGCAQSRRWTAAGIGAVHAIGRRDHSGHGDGAGDESRTRDLNLGKVALYQLSYS